MYSGMLLGHREPKSGHSVTARVDLEGLRLSDVSRRTNTITSRSYVESEKTEERIKQKDKNKLVIDTENIVVVTRGLGRGAGEGVACMVTDSNRLLVGTTSQMHDVDL